MGEFAKDDARLVLLATGRDEYWQSLYQEMRSPFRLYFLKHTELDSEQVLGLYQDAMVVVHRKATQGDLVPPLRSSIKTYLFGVGKMLYRKQINSTRQWTDEIPEVGVPPVIEDRAEQREKAAMVRGLLSRIDEGCRELLTLVYIRGFSMEAVADELAISNAGAARKRKFDCLKKMRRLLPN